MIQKFHRSSIIPIVYITALQERFSDNDAFKHNHDALYQKKMSQEPSHHIFKNQYIIFAVPSDHYILTELRLEHSKQNTSHGCEVAYMKDKWPTYAWTLGQLTEEYHPNETDVWVKTYIHAVEIPQPFVAGYLDYSYGTEQGPIPYQTRPSSEVRSHTEILQWLLRHLQYDAQFEH